jgi:hypothetical protein
MALVRGEKMPEVTYISEVECLVLVPNGIMDTQVVGVPDENDRKHTIRVGRGSLVEHGGKTYLPVGLVRVDRENRKAMVELPQEADSGTTRIWVPFVRFRRQENGG